MPAKKQITRTPTGISIPVANFTAGQNLGPYTTGNLPSTANGYIFDFTYGTWPSDADANGNPVGVISFSALESLDGGAIWPQDASSVTLASILNYDPTVQYNRHNQVQFSGAIYICTLTPPTAGIDPTNSTYWGAPPAPDWYVDLGDPGSATRRLQITGQVLLNCSLGVVVSSY